MGNIKDMFGVSLNEAREGGRQVGLSQAVSIMKQRLAQGAGIRDVISSIEAFADSGEKVLPGEIYVPYIENYPDIPDLVSDDQYEAARDDGQRVNAE